MEATLMQQCRVSEEGPWVVKLFYEGRWWRYLRNKHRL